MKRLRGTHRPVTTEAGIGEIQLEGKKTNISRNHKNLERDKGENMALSVPLLWPQNYERINFSCFELLNLCNLLQ